MQQDVLCLRLNIHVAINPANTRTLTLLGKICQKSEWLPINSRESELQTCNILFPKPFQRWKHNDVCEGWTNKNKGKWQPCWEEGHTRKNKSHWLLGEWNSERGFLLRDGWCRWQGDRLEWCCLRAASHLIFFSFWRRPEDDGRGFLPHPAKEGEAFLCYKLGCKDTWHMFPSWKGLFAFALKNILYVFKHTVYIFLREIFCLYKCGLNIAVSLETVGAVSSRVAHSSKSQRRQRRTFVKLAKPTEVNWVLPREIYVDELHPVKASCVWIDNVFCLRSLSRFLCQWAQQKNHVDPSLLYVPLYVFLLSFLSPENVTQSVWTTVS